MAIWLGGKKPTKPFVLLFGLTNCRTNFFPSIHVRCALKIYLLPLLTCKFCKDTVSHKWGQDYLGNQKTIFPVSWEHLSKKMRKIAKECWNLEGKFKVMMFQCEVIISCTFVLVVLELTGIRKIGILLFFLSKGCWGYHTICKLVG